MAEKAPAKDGIRVIAENHSVGMALPLEPVKVTGMRETTGSPRCHPRTRSRTSWRRESAMRSQKRIRPISSSFTANIVLAVALA